jgi:RNA-binding protein YhbY
MKHVETQLKTRELVKVKIQKSALTTTETNAVAEKVAALTGSMLVEVMGHTFTLYKRRELGARGEKR